MARKNIMTRNVSRSKVAYLKVTKELRERQEEDRVPKSPSRVYP
jgi:hypothetical protein